jgi:hypothetical protein
MDKEALEQFGSEFIERTRDVVVDQFLMMKAGEMNSSDAKEINALLKSFDLSQQAIIEKIVLQFIDRTLHKVLFLFEDSDQWAIADKDAVEEREMGHIAEISDGLTGELYGDNGWLAKFGTYQERAMKEK